MNNITRIFDVELRAKQGDSREVEGYAVVFNASTDLGYFTEEIDKHAFDNCDMSDVYLLFNHDENQILAGTANNSCPTHTPITDLTEFQNMIKNSGVSNKISNINCTLGLEIWLKYVII